MNIPRILTFLAILFAAALTAVAEDTSVPGREIKVTLPFLPSPKKKMPQPPEQITCWLPRDCERVRGVVVAHPMIKELALGDRFRRVAADEGLGMMVSAAVFAGTGRETMERIDQVLAEWAEKSGHPEIKGAAVFMGGLSASVIATRNVGYGAPDRCFGILHVAGGNLHERMNDERKTLASIPFMAVNGEYEVFGPEGGIRPRLGLDTQWYLMGDTMLERRKEDPNNLMSLVVVPGKGHTAWNKALAALFLRKAAQYRLPKERRDGSTPAQCVTLAVEDGWLTDRDVKNPRHPPAPYREYAGDRGEAFWHFDREMAEAVAAYHRDGIRPGQERSIFRPAGSFEKLWPLGEPMNPALAGDASAARALVLQKTGAPLLADAIADAPREDEASIRKTCLRLCYVYDDLLSPLLASIEKSSRTPEEEAALSRQYADLALEQWPAGRDLPSLPLRGLQSRLESASPEDDRAILDALYGTAPRPPAIADLVRLMDFAAPPENHRAAVALGEMGAEASAALPDLRRATLRGGTTEDEGKLSREALAATLRIVEPKAESE